MPSSLRLPAEVQAEMEWLASKHDRSINKEIVQACKAWIERYQMIIAVAPEPGKYEEVKQELEASFEHVQPIKIKNEWSFEVGKPKDGRPLREWFPALQRRYFEVGWRD